MTAAERVRTETPAGRDGTGGGGGVTSERSTEQEQRPRRRHNYSERRATVLAALQHLATCADAEIAHSEADALLLQLINDAEITAAFHQVHKWYA